MDSPDTVTDAVKLLAAEGYGEDFELVGGVLQWGDRQATCTVGDVQVERLYRFEGPSDPGDEMIVFGLYDPASDTRGTLASGFGPSADPEVLDHLVGLTTRYRPMP
ncbi:hypothetical protein KSP35_13835 [Aquihabitans sp. G128]|uniref:hypothetical protein n=1 Tax=Aquihabitans sp. G128 TaxID=2849779 RepID=UPI001C235E27|nr:hypothetical protein [Aquihabitans sp. G128]QXC59476.1 hypothetical protein KSP35_13835 [Aquihabitans sp. G128]